MSTSLAPPQHASPRTIPEQLRERLASIVGVKRVLAHRSELFTYTADGLPGYRKHPALAVFPGTRDELLKVVRELAKARTAFVVRGAGTGLSGGALAEGTVLLGVQRLTRVVDVDADNRRAVVEPGVVNSAITRAVAGHGLHFAPDPSSQAACTIGGNVAENAGGPHCLKYGVTLNHVLALTVALPDGEVVTLGNPCGENEGYDLLGAFVGSEGCFGVVLDATIRLSRDPQAVRTLLADFTDVDDAARAVSGIVAAGIVPAALEMMDNATIRAVEASVYAAGYPADAAAVLLVELDGLEAGITEEVARVDRICRDSRARDVRIARDANERMKLWQGRKKAFGAMGRVAPHLVVQDAVVPRTKLPDVLREIRAIGERHRVRVCNVFHAGDGNLHPNIPYDAANADEATRVERAMSEIMRACIAAGGTITGEHGVGLDKIGYMDLVFSGDSLAAMCRLRDVFDPERRANPGKVVPMHSCREWGRSAAPASVAALRAPLAAGPLAEETARIRDEIREARERRAPVRIVGAGTWLDAGAPVNEPRQLAVRDAAIVEYVPGDLTMTARAGASLASLAAAAREHGQFLALDPMGARAGTLGATLATASAGPLAHAFGTPRDNVLGVELVTGEGLVARGGGRVVKNVAGFDLVRLAVGAWGTLGVITEATLRLRALPERELTIALALPDDSRRLTAVLESVRALPLAALALEVVNAPLAGAIGAGERHLLLARLGGNEALVAAQRATLAAIGDVAELPSDVWARLREAEPAGHAVVRLSTLPSIASSLAAEAANLAPETLVHATLSRGVVRCILPPHALGRGFVARDREYHGTRLTRIWERLPAARWRELAGPGPSDRLTRRTRDAFDPDRVLNRGILGEER
ncbi:MAG TPA: FAD-linked oxidase C-terminal domain-containing protein [Gemmatimonadaceae bacterium]|nr:FAD-linked oxidase C-terminal domain-containing protein [Gemmatimonadaceae bacterium]